ncbi:hypothetical protein B0H14DRAFT_3421577 [Mycena olivaceomarginata]|nr:hypothetical protein B0H14DRAFT_3421577 [Mycena olivaceomarginata]
MAPLTGEPESATPSPTRHVCKILKRVYGSKNDRRGQDDMKHAATFRSFIFVFVQGNHYCHRESSSGGGYHYSNSSGSYYSNPNGSTYYNTGSDSSTYTSPSGYTMKK